MALESLAASSWLTAVVSVYAAIGFLSTLILGFCMMTVFILRPWDGNFRRNHSYVHGAPFLLVLWNSWLVRVAELVVALKPGPMHVADIAGGYVQSQVLFCLVNLGIPDMLAKSGPMSAEQLAAALNASTKGSNIKAAWLERLLTSAYVMGMLNRNKPSAKAQPKKAVKEINISASSTAAAINSVVPAAALAAKAAAPACTYALNATSASLVSASPVNMSSFVKLLEDDYAAMTHLSEGLLTGTVPFELYSKGRSFWEHLGSSERHAATFDVAMLQKRHVGGTSLVVGYPWDRFDTIIDVAGGVGTFTADLLSAHPKLKAVVLDQQQQIARGKKIWAADHQELLPRVNLVAGDIFNSDTIPAPPEGSASVAYVLYDILHNWPAASAVAILRSIRQAVERGSSGSPKSAPRVMLLLLEVTKVEEVLPCHLPFRCGSDLVMMTLFGDGCERNKQQFEELLTAAGWKLTSMVPTNGCFIALEASPQ